MEKIWVLPVIIFFVFAILFAGCLQNNGAQGHCGNGTCEVGETNANCPADCKSGKIISAENVSYGTDAEQKMDVFYFSGNEKAPLAVLVHGGGWIGGDKKSMLVYNDFFNEKGIAVASINYRLSTATENSFPIPVEDVACAVAFLKKNSVKYGIDAEQIFLVGHSAGAHLAAMVAYNPEGNWLNGCAVQGEDLNVKGFIGSSGPYDFELLRTNNAVQLKEFLGPLYSGSDWSSAEPISFVNSNDTPGLLITGDQDCFLNRKDQQTGKCLANSQSMKNALDAAGVYNQLVVVPGYNHNQVLSQFSQTPELQTAVSAFVAAILPK